MKLKQFILLAALGLTATAMLTSCEDILGHWEKPTPATPGTTPTPASYVMAADATEADKGKLICTDGHIHANGADAECTKDRVAMIVYVGSEGETDATYNHGLAIALSDASTGAKWGANGTGDNLAELTDYTTWCSATPAATDADTDMAGIANTTVLVAMAGSDASNYQAGKAAADYKNSVAAPEGTSDWFLPSAGQWYKFFNGMCGLTWSQSDPGFGWATGGSDNLDAANKAFEDAGYDSAKFDGTGTGTYYWSSSEHDDVNAVLVLFHSSGGVRVNTGSKSNSYRVRSFLAF